MIAMSSSTPTPADDQMPPIDDEPEVMPPIDDGVGAAPPMPSVGVGRRAPVAAIASLLLLVGILVLVTLGSFGGIPAIGTESPTPAPTLLHSPSPTQSISPGAPS